MAIALVNLTFDIGDLINTPAAPSGTKVWIETNIDGDVVIDPDGNVIRLGLAKAVVGSTGAGSFVGLVATNAATNPTNFQYKVHVDYRLPYGNNPGRGSGHDGRGSWDSGWFSLTTSQDLADVVAEQYVPPTFITQATADLQAMIDQGLQGPQGIQGPQGVAGGSDAATAGWVTSGPLTSAALSASIAASGVPRPDDVGYDVVLLVGQSNMSGRGMAYDAVNFDPQSARIQQYAAAGPLAGTIAQAFEPLGMPDFTALGPIGMGPGLVFARWYSEIIPSSRRVLLVPAAYGSTSFSASAPLTWDRTKASDTLASRAVTQANAAIRAAGTNARLVGILWCQGEFDALASMSQSTYAAKLDDLIAYLRANITGASATTPFVIARITPGFVNADSRAVPIEAAQIATPSRVAYAAVSPGPSGYDDALHFTAAGQRIAGLNAFRAFLTARQAASVVALAVPAAVTGLAVTISATGVVVSWTPQGQTASYKVEASNDAGSTWTTISASLYGNTAAWTVPAAGTWKFRVTGINEAGNGAPATVDATIAAPGTVTGLTVGTTAARSVSLTCAAVTAGSQPVTYLAEISTNGGTTWAAAGEFTTPAFTITGLTPSTAHSIRSRARSAGIYGSYSSTVGVTTAAPITITDNFTRSDSTSSAGPLWTNLGGVFGVRSNAAYLVSGSSSTPWSAASTDCGSSDGTVSVDMVIATGGSLSGVGLAFRIVDGSNYFGVRVSQATSVVQVFRIIGGASSTIYTSPTQSITVIGTNTLAVVLTGSSIVVKLNGTTITTLTDATNQTSTKHGLWGIGPVATATNLDNFSFTDA